MNNAVILRIITPLRFLYAITFPVNSKRRVLVYLVIKSLLNPLIFFKKLNWLSVITFISCFCQADASAITSLVNQAFIEPEDIKLNNYFLSLIDRNIATVSSSERFEPVDVILPVYNAFDLTKLCVESVYRNSTNCHLIIINDASTDERIKPYFNLLKSDTIKNINLTVIHNEKNQGFVKSVNKAWEHTTHHFVILNSDTEVPSGWLDRLFAPIFTSQDSIGSVTPFSNSGMACSFPDPFVDNLLPEMFDVNSLDAIFSAYGSFVPIDLFTGVGFCMAFNCNVVKSIGLFNEAFGKGYGEECDWSVRAFRNGFRNVLVPNLFVYHKHGGSFGSEEKKALLSANIDKFWSLHSDLRPAFNEFVRKDEAVDVRDALSLLLNLKVGSMKCVAIIDVNSTGGGTMYSARLAEYIENIGHIVLHCKYDHKNDVLSLSCRGIFQQRKIYLPNCSIVRLTDIFEFLGVVHIYVNELFTWPDPQQVMISLSGSKIPYTVLAHDFFLACPSWFLLNEKGSFCDIPENQEVCKKCLDANNYSGHHDLYNKTLDNVLLWRSSVLTFLTRANRFICFSDISAKYFLKLYPSLDHLEVIEHSIPDKDIFTWRNHNWQPGTQMRIAILGNLHHIKGGRVVRELINDHEFQKMDVRLLHFGHAPYFSAGYVSKGGSFEAKGGYQRVCLSQLLEKCGVVAVVIPSVGAETFSYTTSEALLMGYPVICFDIGAQAERVRQCGGGILVSDISAEGLKVAIKELLSSPETLRLAAENTRNYIPISEFDSFSSVTSQLPRLIV